MTIETQVRGGVQIIRLVGELVGEHDGDFVESVTNLLIRPGVRIVIDLSGVPFMNSTGLNDLVRVVAQANVQEGRVVLAGPSAFVAGVLQTTQLDRFFEVCPGVSEALARLG